MPKIVDRDEKRREIGQVILRVMGRDGLGALTIRGIAREGGFSSGVLAHYFTNKEEMVQFAFETVAEMAFERIHEKLAVARSGLQKLQILVEELLPSHEDDIESIVAIAFWGTALHDEPLLQQFHDRYENWRNHVRDALMEAVANGEIERPQHVEDEVDLIVSATDGLLVSLTLDPKRFSKARKARLVSRIVSGLSAKVTEMAK
ncbi:MAG: TetR/AcrR family transcriptional regulator [Burkholderia sp.]|jgi:AcrR family transcriptional regulator|uniref:TetR/AcrR family transcriptional regulator n=1 Tax=Burkholderia sp. TaxID=36773 RepID=UPI0028234689|nr:TetR/AcrR family transcriptional regulator [Burkholderia sp.]MDR0242923.1 TetR/AcrR family transcriptional regulator [Burkholderia sp.]